MEKRSEFLTLHEFNNRVRCCIESSLDAPVWLQTEVSEVRENAGNCYLEFVEKDPDGNGILAKSSAVVWKRTWTLLKPYFEHTTSQRLVPGLQVLVQVVASFHEVYGYKLVVLDIDPTYTIGDIASRRRDILRKLAEEGVADMNKELPLPLLLKRIAVISSPSAAGWGDFSNQLQNNQFGFTFHTKLFPAIMQGDSVEPSVIAALDLINNELDDFDVVVIIRGGGAVSDLMGFDTLALAEHVAQFPLPVITGIGHERDDTIIDMIAHTRVKTPTAAAEMIINHQLRQWQRILDLADRLSYGVRNTLTSATARMQQLQMNLSLHAKRFLDNRDYHINLLSNKLPYARNIIKEKEHRLEVLLTKIDAAEPEKLLRLGYAIVRHEGHAVKQTSELQSASKLSITLSDGTVELTVK